jgi:hypothetical protein
MAMDRFAFETPAMRKARLIAASILLLTGITHIVQLLFLAKENDVIGAALFGLLDLGSGLGILLWPQRKTLGLAIFVPCIGATLGSLRFYEYPNPFSVAHVAVDMVIAPLCIYVFRRWPKAAKG